MNILFTAFVSIFAMMNIFGHVHTSSINYLDAPNAYKAVVEIDSNGSYGSGFLISSDGYLLTAGHVAELFNNGQNALITTYDHKTYSAHVVKKADRADAAIMKIDNVSKGQFQFLKVGPYTLQRGDEVTAWGWGRQMINGQVQFHNLAPKKLTILNPDMLTNEGHEAMCTPGVNPGDSGGVVINSKGEAEGIIIAIRVINKNSILTNISEIPQDWVAHAEQ